MTVEHHRGDKVPTLSAVEQPRLWRKVDVRFLPIVIVLYLCSFLDRSNIGNAKLQGLTVQLHLTGARYNVALTMFFIAYNCFTIPANLVIKRFRPSRWLPGITVTWGIVMTLSGLVKTYPQLVGVRVCLGIAESGLAAGVFYHFTLWYPRYMLQVRIGLFWAGATLSGAFSGLLAFAISFMDGIGGLEGWSWIFIIEGLVTVVAGVVAFLVMIDFPDTAAFLTSEERAYIVQRNKYDSCSVGEEEHFEIRHIKEALLDWQVWLLSTINMSVTTAIYGISLFLPSIINGFGYTTAISQPLTIPPYFVATINVLIWSYWSDSIQMRSPFIAFGLVLCLVGFTLNIADLPIGVKYFGTFLVATGGYSAFPSTTAWIPNNIVGHYKRAVAIAIDVILGNFGGVIASNSYRAQDAPRYIMGHAIELGFVCLGLVLVPLAVLVYMHINSRRDMIMKENREKGVKLSPEELRRLGDRAPDFRHTL